MRVPLALVAPPPAAPAPEPLRSCRHSARLPRCCRLHSDHRALDPRQPPLVSSGSPAAPAAAHPRPSAPPSSRRPACQGRSPPLLRSVAAASPRQASRPSSQPLLRALPRALAALSPALVGWTTHPRGAACAAAAYGAAVAPEPQRSCLPRQAQGGLSQQRQPAPARGATQQAPPEAGRAARPSKGS